MSAADRDGNLGLRSGLVGDVAFDSHLRRVRVVGHVVDTDLAVGVNVDVLAKQGHGKSDFVLRLVLNPLVGLIDQGRALSSARPRLQPSREGSIAPARTQIGRMAVDLQTERMAEPLTQIGDRRDEDGPRQHWMDGSHTPT